MIGFGRVEYGPSTAYGQTVEDGQNVTDHSLTLTGLQPATTYSFRVSNRHAIDGDELAAQTGSFTTLSTFSAQFLQPLTQSNDPASPVVNTGKNGRVIPVKLQLSQSGEAITDLNAPGPVTIAVSGLACGTSAGSDPVSSYADAGQSSAGTNQFRYDALAQAWVYNLDTKALGIVT
ncbi:MAG: PxKF domain-containing protein [Nocardioidaceae bacterium]